MDSSSICDNRGFNRVCRTKASIAAPRDLWNRMMREREPVLRCREQDD
jgi:hypothetical protein